MIKSVGIDAVEIDRFSHWISYKPHQLQRMFSSEEISYAFSSENYAQRLAVRFAAKEAFYKALSSMFPEFKIPLLSVGKLVQVTSEKSAPTLNIDWGCLSKKAGIILEKIPKTYVSLTHTRTTAIAVVIIEQ
jgi:holo-[acyl-carrier protein] synthase